MIETVDSFQGKQLDVVILSCVRASEGRAGVGFLADVRRMNVAITRAKAALWVLGSAQTLKRSPVWAALLADAEARGLVIPHASARCAPGPTLQPWVRVQSCDHLFWLSDAKARGVVTLLFSCEVVLHQHWTPYLLIWQGLQARFNSRLLTPAAKRVDMLGVPF